MRSFLKTGWYVFLTLISIITSFVLLITWLDLVTRLYAAGHSIISISIIFFTMWLLITTMLYYMGFDIDSKSTTTGPK